MGCGISKFDEKDQVDESYSYTSPHADNSNKDAYDVVACESKPLIGEARNVHSPPEEDQTKKTDSSVTLNDKSQFLKEDVEVKAPPPMPPPVKHGDPEEEKDYGTEKRNVEKLNDDGWDTESTDSEEFKNQNAICRGESPSFRVYCVNLSSRSSRSIRIEEDSNVGVKEEVPEETPNLEKETENQTGTIKKERRGRRFMNALQRSRETGRKHFMTASRRPFSSTSSQSQNNDVSSHNIKTS